MTVCKWSVDFLELWWASIVFETETRRWDCLPHWVTGKHMVWSQPSLISYSYHFAEIKRHEEMLSLLSFYWTQWETCYPHLWIKPSLFTTLSEQSDVSLAFLHKRLMNYELLSSLRIPNSLHNKALPEVDSLQWLLECERISPGILSDAFKPHPTLNTAITALRTVPLYLRDKSLPGHEKKSDIFPCHNAQSCSTDLLSALLIKRKICPESTQPCTMKNREIYWRRYKKQEMLYIGQWHISPLQSRHIGNSHSFSIRHQLPHHIFLNLTDGLKSLPFQRWF